MKTLLVSSLLVVGCGTAIAVATIEAPSVPVQSAGIKALPSPSLEETLTKLKGCLEEIR